MLTESEQAFTEFTRNPHEGIGARAMPSEGEASLATRSQQNHSFVYFHIHRHESYSRGGPSSTETPVTDTTITGWRDDRPSTAVVGSTYATKKTDMVVPCFSAQITVRVHAGVIFHRRSPTHEITREGTAQSVAVPSKSSQNGGNSAL